MTCPGPGTRAHATHTETKRGDTCMNTGQGTQASKRECVKSSNEGGEKRRREGGVGERGVGREMERGRDKEETRSREVEWAVTLHEGRVEEGACTWALGGEGSPRPCLPYCPVVKVGLGPRTCPHCPGTVYSGCKHINNSHTNRTGSHFRVLRQRRGQPHTRANDRDATEHWVETS